MSEEYCKNKQAHGIYKIRNKKPSQGTRRPTKPLQAQNKHVKHNKPNQTQNTKYKTKTQNAKQPQPLNTKNWGGPVYPIKEYFSIWSVFSHL